MNWRMPVLSRTMLERAAFRRNQAFVSKLAIQAANRMFEVSGGSAMYNWNPLQRFFRDAHCMSHHIVTTWDPVAEQYAKVSVGPSAEFLQSLAAITPAQL